MSTPRFALRSLTRAPSFSIATTATIALSIGAGCAMFGLVNAVLLRPLPFANADRLVGVWHTMPGLNIPLAKVAPGTYEVYRESAKSFDAIGVYLTLSGTLSYRNANTPAERARVGYVTPSIFSTLGARPLLGRLFVELDAKHGAEPVALISERVWRERFGGTASVLDRFIEVDGTAQRIVGVMPTSFRFPESATPVWVPLDPSPGGYIGGFGFSGVARLRPGVTQAAAQRELAQLLPRVLERFPEVRPGISSAGAFEQTKLAPVIHALRDDVIGGFDRVLWLIAGTVAVLVVVAFSNVSLLLLVRIESRQRELALCSALGASRWQVLARLVSESTIVAVVGGAIGFALAASVIGALVSAGPADIPRLAEVRVDSALALSALVLSAAFVAMSTLIGAARVPSKDVIQVLRDGGRAGTSGRVAHRLRAAFVAIEVALSLVLLAGAGVLGRSMLKLRDVQPGFDPSNLFTFWTFLPPTSYTNRESAARFFANAIDRFEQIPGVTSVAATAKLPLEVEGFAYQVLIYADVPNASNTLPPVFQTTTVTSGYFDTMRIPMIAGRSFDDANIRRGALEAIASRGFIQHFWHDSTGRSGVGKRLRPTPKSPWFTIVGVVGDVRDSTLTRPPVSAVYFPEEKSNDSVFTTARDMAFVVRTHGPTPGLPSALRRELRAMDPNLPFYRAATMDEIVVDARAHLTFALGVLAVGAIATLLLGVVGLYGVIAYALSLRTREIGIRIALGLTPAAASRLMLKQGEAVIAVGAAAGLVIFLLFAKLLASVTFEVQTIDATSLVAAVVLVVIITSLATWLPARRAANVDPTEALRAD